MKKKKKTKITLREFNWITPAKANFNTNKRQICFRQFTTRISVQFKEKQFEHEQYGRISVTTYLEVGQGFHEVV